MLRAQRGSRTAYILALAAGHEGKTPVKVTGELEKRILANLGDPESMGILDAVVRGSKATTTIEHEMGLAQSTIYRKIASLRECGLLMVDRYVLRPDGKKEALYTLSFSEVRLKTEADGIRLEVVESAQSVERRWFEIFFRARSNRPGPPPPGVA